MPVLSSIVTQPPAGFRAAQVSAGTAEINTLNDGQIIANLSGLLSNNALAALAQETLGILPAPPAAPAPGLFGAGGAAGFPGFGGFGGLPFLGGFGFPFAGAAAAPALNAPTIAFNSMFGSFINNLVNRLSANNTVANYINFANSALVNNAGNLLLLWTWW